MGELLLGRPIVQLHHRSSETLDLLSYISLLYRAVPGSGLSARLITDRRNLDRATLDNLDLLNGFSGRLLYYLEEPVMAFEAATNDTGSIETMLDYLAALSPDSYRTMALRSLERAHGDLKSKAHPPADQNVEAWREYILPTLTTATPEDALRLLDNPDELKERTISLFRDVWLGYKSTYTEDKIPNEVARALAEQHANQGFGLAFAELTGHRLPATLASRLNEIEDVTFLPSQLVGGFVSYILYPPNVYVFYGAPELLDRLAASNGRALPAPEPTPVVAEECLDQTELLEALKALSDPNRLKIIEMLSTGELYAQEIVGQLNVAQSAVSRHLSLLERSRLIEVAPRRGMKYYTLNRDTLRSVSEGLLGRCV